MTQQRIPKEKQQYLDSIRQDITFSDTLLGQDLTFQTTWGLFSPKGTDEGTRLLLDHMDIGENDDTLDLGCGYGPLGLTLAKMAPGGTSLLVDKDFVAVEYSKRNAEINQITNAEVLLSNGFSNIGKRQFDLIVSNLPAKTGKELYYLYFYDALLRMKPGAHFYVVTISGLRKFVQKAFMEVFGNYKKLKQGKTYTVARAQYLPNK